MRLLGLLILLSLLSISTFEAIAEPIKIGAIVSQTGSAAEQGRNWLQGVELAKAQLQREGVPIELITEDDGTRPAGSVSAFTKLVAQDKVRGIVGGTWDFLAEAVAPLSQRYRVPFVTPTNPVEVFSTEARGVATFFTNGLSIRATERSILDVLPSTHEIAIALVVPNAPFGALHAEIFERLAATGKVRIVSKTVVDYAGYHDTLKATAMKIAAQNADIVFCLSDGSGLNLFVGELNRRRYRGWILTTQHLDEAAKLSSTPEHYRKVIGFYPRVRDESFEGTFVAKFGHAPRVYAAEGYDALLFLAHALEPSTDFPHRAFEIGGITGKLRFEPGQTEISSLEAIPMVIGPSGHLESWHSKMTIDSGADSRESPE
jgi:branched-chain amino acid transport system substrate-binding protein